MISRRNALLASLLAAAPAAAAQERGLWPFGRRAPAPQAEPEMDHSAHLEAIDAPEGFPAGAPEEAAARALAECTRAGEACLSHCIAALSAGDASLAACARNVRDTIAVCRASESLLGNRSVFAARALTMCKDVCAACREECLKHASHHNACADCASACSATIAVINALLG
jgi:Cys-rich four helix bundle protein (predicted Tat secretion target)